VDGIVIIRMFEIAFMSYQDTTNRIVWSAPGAQRWLTAIQGFIDCGEEAAYARVADEMRDKPILDLGVGAGRTIPLLRKISPRYVAIDYLPSLIEVAHRKYPDADICAGDARDLSQFADASFALVVFSYAGIDAVDHDGREKIFREVSRVLQPSGVFWFSTLNKDGPELKRRPWNIEWPARESDMAGQLITMARAIKHAIDGIRNYSRLKKMQHGGDGWAIAPFSSHDFGLLVHYTSLAQLRIELTAVGFYPDIEAIAPNGAQLNADADLSRVDFFNILARKRGNTRH
jgi:ubiquinone/menaquinone biosynthesis C-methylase UbiE